MKLQLPTLIAVCLAILLIGGIYFFGRDKPELGIAVNLESEEFKQLRTHATDAFNAGKYQQAIELYSTALKMRPENAEIYNDLGTVYYEQGLKYAGPSWPSWEKELREDSVDEAVAELKVAVNKTGSGAIMFKTRDEAVADALLKKRQDTSVARYIDSVGKMKQRLTFSLDRRKSICCALATITSVLWI